MMVRALSLGLLLSLFVVGCGKDEENAGPSDGAVPADGGGGEGGLDAGPAPPGFEQVADLNTRKAAALTQYDPQFVEAAGKVFFVGDNGQHGLEPMASDGTVAGTKLLKDLVAGTEDGNAGAFIAKGDKVYFYGRRDASTNALFRTDGTPEGTVPLVDGQGGSSTQAFRVGEKLCFLDSTLRCSNDAVTALNKVLDSTSTSSGASASLGSIAVFTNASALWSTDGATATKLVDVSIMPGGVVVSGKLVFWAQASGQTRPFMSDGTVAGSRVLGDVIGSGSTTQMIALGSKALTVNAGQALILDPTAITSTPLTDLYVSSATALGSGKALLLAERRSVSPLIGSELWITDGTDAGTALVTELNPGSGGSSIKWIGAIGSEVLFLQNDSSSSTQRLYKSDGTAAGTVKLGDWNVDTATDRPGFTSALGKVVFRCADTSSWQTLCTLDATGKIAVVPINRTTAPSSPHSFTPWGEKFFVAANDGDEPRSSAASSMFVSDGTPAGTKRVGGRFGGRMASLGGNTFFTRIAPDGTDKWELAMFGADPAAASTVATFNYTGNLEYSSQYPMVAFAGKIWFAANGTSSSFTVYSSDGTATGTKSMSYTPTANYAQYGGATWPVVGDRMYVPTTSGVQVVDATGTFTSLGVAPGKVTAIDAAEGRIWFAIGGTLWITDGTAIGTTQVKVITSSSSNPIWKIVAISKGSAFVFTGSGSSPTAWASDGTATGTTSIGSVPGWTRFKSGLAFLGSGGVSLVSAAVTTPVVIGPRANRLLGAGDRLFFSATDDVHGEELWVSDGTKAGTKLAGDLRIGKESSAPTPLAVHGGYLYFSADNGAIGAELWRYRLN